MIVVYKKRTYDKLRKDFLSFSDAIKTFNKKNSLEYLKKIKDSLEVLDGEFDKFKDSNKAYILEIIRENETFGFYEILCSNVKNAPNVVNMLIKNLPKSSLNKERSVTFSNSLRASINRYVNNYALLLVLNDYKEKQDAVSFKETLSKSISSLY